MRVLVADDERMTRTLLERTLVRWGHSVTTSPNGLEAWEHLTKARAVPVRISPA